MVVVVCAGVPSTIVRFTLTVTEGRANPLRRTMSNTSRLQNLTGSSPSRCRAAHALVGETLTHPSAGGAIDHLSA
jgi:hypothetical protein